MLQKKVTFHTIFIKKFFIIQPCEKPYFLFTPITIFFSKKDKGLCSRNQLGATYLFGTLETQTWQPFLRKLMND